MYKKVSKTKFKNTQYLLSVIHNSHKLNTEGKNHEIPNDTRVPVVFFMYDYVFISDKCIMMYLILDLEWNFYKEVNMSYD